MGAITAHDPTHEDCMPSGLSIGQAAEQTGLSPKAIRLYEQKALLPPSREPRGSPALRRGTLAVLRFIRQAKEIGLRLLPRGL